MAEMIGGLAYILRTDTAQFTGGFRKAGSAARAFGGQMDGVANRLANFTKGLLAAAGVGGIGAFVRSSFSAIDAAAKTADKLGLTTQALAGLRLAAEQTGVAANTLDMGLQRMVRRVAEAAQGTGEAKSALAELGVSAVSLARLAPDEQFRAIADAMGNVGDQSDRVRLAFKLFDSEGVSLVNTLKLGRSGLDAMAKDAEQLGTAVNRFDAGKVERANDAVDRLGKAFQGAANRLAVNFAPSVERLAKMITNAVVNVTAFVGAADRLTGGLAKTAVGASAVAVGVAAVTAGLVAAGRYTISLTTGIIAQTRAWLAKTAAVEADTAALARNAIASATAGAAGRSGLNANQAARLAELRGAAVSRFQGRQDAQVAAGTPLGQLKAANPAIANMAKNATAAGAAVGTAGAATGRFAGIAATARVAAGGLATAFGALAAAAAIPLALLAGFQAIRNFWTWATEGSEKVGILGESFARLYYRIAEGRDIAAEARLAQTKHNNAIADYQQKQDAAALAAERLAAAEKQRLAQAAALTAYENKRVEGFRKLETSLAEQLFAASKPTDRQRALQDLSSGASGVFAGDRGAAADRINAMYDLIEARQAQVAMRDRWAEGIRSAEDAVRDFGLTANQVLIRDMREALQTAIELGDATRQIEIGQLLQQMQGAAAELDRMNAARDLLSDVENDVAAAYRKQNDIRKQMDELGKNFRPGYVQQGSLAEFNQARNVSDISRQMAALQQKSIEVQKEIAELIREEVQILRNNPGIMGEVAQLPVG